MNSPTSDAGVRTARPNDVPAVAHVQAAVWRATYGPLVDSEVRDAFKPAAFEPAWRQSLRNPPTPLHRLLVATEGDTVVGFAAIGPCESAEEPAEASEPSEPTTRTGEIFTFGVSPDRRGAGNGSRLLNAAVDTLRAGDFAAVTMWVLADDEQTRTFVAAAGLQPDGAWRDRVVAADGRTAREVRLAASLTDPDAATAP
ncbi:N-acetyltransferase [Flexivirga endophytica]|uniref:N-acetyltransferase n=1 Tax=Flexivirga endophytica TaxID=1849103 RepID=A0A916SUG3_9MICO|nr:GNAT family N-acetyltransferase [Flexivirga endophytica]GGB17097.1 N-acetyltransferase [Flexivirga endophytica]GHB38478.1 N-acetyltransferase [Flexivirga endophytica]